MMAIQKGADGLPRPWSKYSAGSTAFKKLHEEQEEKKKKEFEVVETDAYREKQKKVEEHIKKLHADENDPKLREYLDVMTSRSKGKTWTNDDLAVLKESEYDQEITASGVKKLNIQDNDESDDDNDTPSDAEPMDEDVKQEEEPAAAAANGEEFKKPEEQIEDTGRLFVRNLAYTCTEQDLKDLFSKYGPLSEVHMPISKETKRPKGFAYILYLLPEHAVKAYKELDNSPFLGRLLHVLPAKEKPQAPEQEPVGPNGIKMSKFKKEKEQKRKNLAGSDFNWNSLYMSVSVLIL